MSVAKTYQECILEDFLEANLKTFEDRRTMKTLSKVGGRFEKRGTLKKLLNAKGW